MNDTQVHPPTAPLALESWPALAEGKTDFLWSWTQRGDISKIIFCCVTILIGCGIYGASIGAWHGGQMALFLTIKFPLIVLFTIGLNGFYNAMLAMLFNTGLSYRETWLAILTSFSIFSLIVLSLSPIAFGMVLAMPGPDDGKTLAAQSHKSLLLTHCALVCFAGFIATQQLWQLLKHRAKSKGTAFFVMSSWMACNLFMGAQIAFLLRPIFGTPHLKVEFLRADQSEGNIYESIWWALTHL